MKFPQVKQEKTNYSFELEKQWFYKSGQVAKFSSVVFSLKNKKT